MSPLVGDLQTVLFFGVVLLALRTSPLNPQATAWVIVALTVGSAGATAAALIHTPAGDAAADLWKGLMLLLTAVLIVRRVLARPTVTVQSIYGALSAYLIIGLMFAAFYAAARALTGIPFFANHQPANTQTFQYFSFTTLTTLGYGDFTAAGNDGRAIAVIEALTGQVFLATLVARLVAAYRSPAPADPPAQADPAPQGDSPPPSDSPAQRDQPQAKRRWPPPGARSSSRLSYRRRSPRRDHTAPGE